MDPRVSFSPHGVKRLRMWAGKYIVEEYSLVQTVSSFYKRYVLQLDLLRFFFNNVFLIELNYYFYVTKSTDM